MLPPYKPTNPYKSNYNRYVSGVCGTFARTASSIASAQQALAQMDIELTPRVAQNAVQWSKTKKDTHKEMVQWSNGPMVQPPEIRPFRLSTDHVPLRLVMGTGVRFGSFAASAKNFACISLRCFLR